MKYSHIGPKYYLKSVIGYNSSYVTYTRRKLICQLVKLFSSSTRTECQSCPLTVQAMTIALPVLSPRKRPMNASGILSNPFTVVSLYLSLP